MISTSTGRLSQGVKYKDCSTIDSTDWVCDTGSDYFLKGTLLMIPPLSTTPSAPTMTRSTFSKT